MGCEKAGFKIFARRGIVRVVRREDARGEQTQLSTGRSTMPLSGIKEWRGRLCGAARERVWTCGFGKRRQLPKWWGFVCNQAIYKAVDCMDSRRYSRYSISYINIHFVPLSRLEILFSIYAVLLLK